MVSSKHGTYGLRSLAVGLALGLSALVGTADVARADDGGGNQVSFRGGWVGMTSDRSSEIFINGGNRTQRGGGSHGSYVGGSLDLLLSKDTWGMMSGTWALGEIGVEYRRLNSTHTTQAATGTTGAIPITMLTVDIAPKLKFMEGSRIRPWIIPIGLDFIVISPPSDGVGYLDIGVQFGAGVEMQLYKAFKLGLDGRFHLAGNATHSTNNAGTLGMYLGIAF